MVGNGGVNESKVQVLLVDISRTHFTQQIYRIRVVTSFFSFPLAFPGKKPYYWLVTFGGNNPITPTKQQGWKFLGRGVVGN